MAGVIGAGPEEIISKGSGRRISKTALSNMVTTGHMWLLST